MLSRICFVSLCVFAAQLYGAERDAVSRPTPSKYKVQCHLSGIDGKSYSEWDVERQDFRVYVFQEEDGNPDKWKGFRGSKRRDGKVTEEIDWLSSEEVAAEKLRLEEICKEQQAKAESLGLKKEYEEQAQARRLKSGTCIIGGLALIYASYVYAPTDYWKNLGSCALKLVIGD